ncbi:hypothetical protein ACFL54_00105 [Planctomycetota bacterium]
MKRITILSLQILLIFLALLSTSNAQQQSDIDKIKSMLTEGEAAYSEEEALAYMKEIIPLIEKVCGKKFKQAPSLKLADREVLQAVLVKEFIPQFKNLSPDASADALKGQAEASAGMIVMCMLGKYGFSDNTLFLLPKNLNSILDMAKIDRKHMKNIVKLVIAHELTHQMQEQEAGIYKTLLGITNQERMMAFNATIEGHAVFIQDLVGKELELDQTVIEFSRLLSAGAVKFDDPLLDLINNVIASQYEQIYLGGKKFIEFHFHKEGHEKLWKILGQYPANTKMIAYPDTYSTKGETKVDLETVLDGLEKEFVAEEDIANWFMQNMELGNLMLNAVYVNFEKEDQEFIVSNVQQAQAFIMQNATGSMANVSIYLLYDATKTQKMLNMLEAFAKKNSDDQSSELFEIKDMEFSDFKLVAGDIARKITFNIVAKENVSNFVVLRVVREQVFMEIFVTNVDVADEKLAAISNKVFKQLETITKKDK